MDKKAIQNKLNNVKYNCDGETHLKVVNKAKCLKCQNKPCTYICPANVYEFDENTREIVVQYENCMECGACKIVCPYGNIEWCYPKSGCGVIYKNS